MMVATSSKNNFFKGALLVFSILFFLFFFFSGYFVNKVNFAVDTSLPEKDIVVLIPSFNNKRWFRGNLHSILTQDYKNFEVYYFDDASPDGTGKYVADYLEKYDRDHKVTLFRNKERIGVTGNLWYGAHYADPHKILMVVDGDDWLANPYVLKKINEEYSKNDIWMTWGQFKTWPTNKIGTAKPFPGDILKKGNFRSWDKERMKTEKYPTFSMSHLRTYYAWLFQQIKLEDLLFDGQFIQASNDRATMYPCVEMARSHSKCLEHDLYRYNRVNPICIWRTNLLQHSRSVLQHLLESEPYKPLTERIDKVKDDVSVVGILFLKKPGNLKKIIEEGSLGVVGAKYVIYDSKIDGMEYAKLAKKYGLKIIPHNEIDTMLSDISKQSPDYVLIISDDSDAEKFDLFVACDYLRKTKAIVFLNPSKVLQENFTYSKPFIKLGNGIVAWQYGFIQSDAVKKILSSSSIFDGKFFNSLYNNREISNVDSFHRQLQDSLSDSSVGLIFEESLV